MEPDPLISYRRKPVSLDRGGLESFAQVLQERVARGREFHCRITNDPEMALLNRRFRGKKGTTDVLSFPAGEPRALGDIAISLGRAREQAREYGHSIEDEIRILLLHGVLHLMGYDHEADAGRMQRAEQRWRRKLGLPTGLIARAGECS
jgi:probable rRNA maturation factor